MTTAPIPDVIINSLTLVITRADCTQITEAEIPTLMRLRGTFRDAALVDRVLFVDNDGTETYIKDRYPAEHMPEDVKVVDHKINRPRRESVEGWYHWCLDIRTLRRRLLINGTLDVGQMK